MVQARFTVEAKDIVGLENPQQIISFFTQLGYTTDLARNEKAPEALRNRLHERTSLRTTIVGVTHVARQRDEISVLDIYLYELPKITRTLRREIVRDVKKLSENCLLILADRGFHELEFVYLDRVATGGEERAESIWQGILDEPNTPSTEPLIRVQRVDRRHPSQIMVTMLREFHVRNADVLAQCTFLSRAFDAAETRDVFFHNHSLFSNYYLRDRLPAESEWQDEVGSARAAALGQTYNTLHQFYDSGASERYTGRRKQEMRAQLFEPVLQALGFTWEQPSSTQAGYDYLLTVPQQDGSETRIVCQVYPWGRLLDDPLTFLAPEEAEHDEDPTENPAVTLVGQIQETGAQWGILTNGKFWRLYSAKARSLSTNYYEIDLEEAFSVARVQGNDKAITAFLYFWLFFRRAAFVVKPAPAHTTPLCFLESALTSSERYARALSDSLKERIFDDIFPRLAQGFVDYARAKGLLRADLLDLPEEARNRELARYFAGTLNFLYRLLFLLYAESRELLPVYDERYSKQSLEALKQEIGKAAGEYDGEARVRNIQQEYHPGENDCRLYRHLWQLFVAIDKGDRDLNVPAYRGDIFLTEPPEGNSADEWNEDEQIAHFLKTHKIPDQYLALGLDLLARDVDPAKKNSTARDADKLSFIDYRSLGVRQLGSIYEGLLEFKLRIAVEPMAVLDNKVVPANGQLPIVYKRGQVYIENDLHERKATGSYYTPDYIVKYIIEETLGPILRARLDKARNTRLRVNLDAYQQKMVQAKRLRRSDAEFQQDLQKFARTHEGFVDECFQINVLDPAMGSGHFLVDAVDYITDYMVERLRVWKPTPLDVSLQNMRQAIQAEAEAQQVSIDSSLLTEINLLKRQVLKRCIFGVDLNPMAVRLAKLSLWIDSLTQGAPFSFLDHHLRCGNSLLGVTLDFMGQATGENLWTHDLYGILASVKGFEKISRNADETARVLAESQALYADALALLRPHQQISNLWLSECYGNTGARQAIEMHKTAIIEGSVTPEQRVTLQNKRKRDARSFGEVDEHYASVLELLARAQQLAAPTGGEGRNFFHWDLEFPEVFFDETGLRPSSQRGFDAIIGNPPYIRQEGLGADKDAFADLYQPVFSSIADIYTYFIARGSHELLRDGGRFGMITSNKFMRANYGAGLRGFLSNQTRLEKLVNFGELRVFHDAATDPVIIILGKGEPASTVTYVQVKEADFRVQNFGVENLAELVQKQGIALPHSTLGSSSWSLSNKDLQTVLEKLKNANLFVPLSVYTGGSIRRGILTGCNDAFFLDAATRDKLIAADPKSAAIIKPLLVGDDVRRYSLNQRERFLIWTYTGIPIEHYPAIYKHLSQYQTQLEKRWDKGKYWWELRPCDYYSDFEKPKIIYPDISMSSRFTLDRNGYFITNTAYTIPKDDPYLLALLNSRLLWLYLSKVCAVLGDADAGGRLRIFTVYVESLPIRNINSLTPSEEHSELKAHSEQLYQTHLDTGNWQELLAFTKQLLAREPEAADVVRDLLAFLAERMLRLNEQRQEKEREVLRFIERTFKISQQPDPKSGKRGLDAFSNKTVLFEYAGDYQKGTPVRPFKEIHDVLNKNRNRCALFGDFASALRELEAEYEKNAASLEPLKDQLRATDELIDQLVYRLYGLNDEEIALVEGMK